MLTVVTGRSDRIERITQELEVYLNQPYRILYGSKGWVYERVRGKHKAEKLGFLIGYQPEIEGDALFVRCFSVDSSERFVETWFNEGQPPSDCTWKLIKLHEGVRDGHTIAKEKVGSHSVAVPNHSSVE